MKIKTYRLAKQKSLKEPCIVEEDDTWDVKVENFKWINDITFDEYKTIYHWVELNKDRILIDEKTCKRLLRLSI